MKQRQAGSQAVRGAAEGWSLARKAEIRLSSQSVLKIRLVHRQRNMLPEAICQMNSIDRYFKVL